MAWRYSAQMSFRILQSFKDLEPLIEAIQRAADSERTAFGFLPPDAYREFVQQGRAIAAVSASKGELAGYCLYGGVFPQAKVFQTYVVPDFRGQSIGERLLRTLFERLESQGYLSITANVASDLADANRFYEKLGFDVVTTKQGGKSKKRVINVRARELPTPSLFDHLDQPTAMATGLSIRNPRQNSVPRYVIDLNVIFDVAKMRPRHEAAAGVIAAAMESEVKLAISAELLSELEKHTTAGKPDPILSFCRSIPTLKIPNQAALSAIRKELRPIVFPEKADLTTLKGNDESDLRHLATAIEEGAAGFITSDEAILRAAIGIKNRFGLSILSPSTFGLGFDAEFGSQPHLSVRTSSSTLEAVSYSESDREEVKLLLDSHHLSIARLRNALAGGTATAPRRRELVRSGGRTIAYASWDWPSISATERELLIYADEKQPDSLLALRHLLQRACSDTGSKSVSALILKPQIGQHLLRKAAISSGFYSDKSSMPRNPTLRRISLGRLILPDDWSSAVVDIEQATGVKIIGAPALTSTDPLRLIDADGAERATGLIELERMFGPTIICAADRQGVILPIWPTYAEELFHGSLQPDFLEHREAAIKPEKAYIGGSYGSIPDGGLAFFYESGAQKGRMAVTAVARITGRYLLPPDQASTISVDRGVLPNARIRNENGRKLKTVVDIDTVMLFNKPIAKGRLSELGCWDGANMVTAKVITPAQAIALLAEGDPRLV